MSLLDNDSWSRDNPELRAYFRRQNAATRAWKAFNAMERATGQVRAAQEDPDTPPEWLDQLRSAALRAGALAIGKEGC